MTRTVYRVFFRITQSESPDIIDFTSRAALGTAPIGDDPELQRLHTGISVYATEQQARNKAHQYPFLGAYVAKLEIPDGAPIRIERTLPRSRGHHTLWGDPAEILKYVVSVVPA